MFPMEKNCRITSAKINQQHSTATCGGLPCTIKKPVRVRDIINTKVQENRGLPTCCKAQKEPFRRAGCIP